MVSVFSNPFRLSAARITSSAFSFWSSRIFLNDSPGRSRGT